MKTAPVDTATAPIAIPFKIAKVDKEKRLVKGVCTAEVLDKDGQIVDYLTAKAVIPEWVGNIREMHEAKAVGKRTSVEFDDDNKQILLESYISKGAEDTWQKVLDGTLGFYSIHGAGVIQKDAAAPKGRILMKEFDEISLVDNGACPVAKFDIVKMVKGVQTDVQPADAVPVVDEASTKRGVLVVELEKRTKDLKAPKAQSAAARAIAKLAAATATVSKAYPEVYDIQSALGAIAQLESLLASEWWEARDEVANGEEGDPQTDQAQLGMLRQAIELVMEFLVSEFDEQFSDFDEAAEAAPEPSVVALAHRVRARDIVTKSLTADRVVAVMKAGARHSKSDLDMIQKMHDTSVGLGASCKMEKAAAAPATPDPAAPATDPVEKKTTDPAPAAVEPTVQDIVKAAVDRALAAQKATSDEAIAALTAKVEKLAQTPRPGGPVARVVPVEKQLAGSAQEPTATEEHDEMLRAFDVIAKQAKTPDEVQTIAAKKFAYMREHGIGAITQSPKPSA